MLSHASFIIVDHADLNPPPPLSDMTSFMDSPEWNIMMCPAKKTVPKGLVTNYWEGVGGLQNGRRRHMKFYLYKKGGGAEQDLAMLKEGHTTFWGSFKAVA